MQDKKIGGITTNFSSSCFEKFPFLLQVTFDETISLYDYDSVVCKASETYRKLAAEYKVDGFVENVTGTEQVTDQVNKLITCLKGKTLSKKEILVSLDLKHRPTLEQDYINPALELGLIEMTQPNSPRSPSQKYRLTEKGKNM